jgi:phosphatidylglycerophosphatase A
MKNQERYKKWIKFFSTCFGLSFYIPLVPGVLGIFLGGILIVFLNYLPFFLKLFFWFFFLVFTLKFTDLGEKTLKRGKDPNVIILDEINALICIGLFFDVFKNVYFFGYSLPLFFFIIIIFSFFDGLKIFPANISEKLEGGRGIVVDDLISAFYTILFLKIFICS